MSKLTLLIISFILFLISYPLISLGTMDGGDALWVAGLVALGLAGLIPPASRYIGEEDDDDNETEDS
jgi:hypothetical protein